MSVTRPTVGPILEDAGTLILNRGRLGFDPLNYSEFTLQFSSMGAGTAQLQVLGPADVWQDHPTVGAAADDEIVTISGVIWPAFRLVFSGTAGAGEVTVAAQQRFD